MRGISLILQIFDSRIYKYIEISFLEKDERLNSCIKLFRGVNRELFKQSTINVNMFEFYMSLYMYDKMEIMANIRNIFRFFSNLSHLMATINNAFKLFVQPNKTILHYVWYSDYTQILIMVGTCLRPRKPPPLKKK